MFDAFRLTIAGLMIILELIGFANPTQTVLDILNKVGYQDYYQNQSISQENNDIKNISLNLNLPASIPQIKDQFSYPVLEASSVVAIDVDSNSILFAKEIDATRAMASVTKIMTAVVALENLKLDQIVTIQPEDTQIEPVIMSLIPQEQITTGNVLFGLLVGSNNDAALTLARVGGEGSVSKFVDLMNKKAQDLGLNNTHFANPHGLDEAGQYSSAKDLALLAKYAMKNPVFAEMVGTKEYTVSSVDGSITHSLKTTNKLFDSYLTIQGIKTGFTDNAGQVLVTQAVNNGHKIITVVMNSPDRFQESKQLIDWVFNNYYWE